MANPHLQTVYATLFDKHPILPYEMVEFTLSDGDFLDAFFYTTRNPQAPFVVLFHGLAGSHRSPYIQRILRTLLAQNYNCVLMHFRGCSGRENRLPRSYHSGDTQDAKEFLDFLQTHYKPSKLYGIGYSLGANMLLKLLGEMQNTSPFDKAVAVSAPLKLALAAKRMHQGFSRYYEYRLLQELKTSLKQKYQRFAMEKLLHLSYDAIDTLNTFEAFDDAYTAPIHGFNSAQEYYAQCSSFHFLSTITTPTRIIHALDDPFMTPAVLPKPHEVPSNIELLISQHGGHVGFIQGSLLQPDYWLEATIAEYFT